MTEIEPGTRVTFTNDTGQKRSGTFLRTFSLPHPRLQAREYYEIDVGESRVVLSADSRVGRSLRERLSPS